MDILLVVMHLKSILEQLFYIFSTDDANTVVFSIWHWHQKPLKILKIVLNMFKTNQPTSEMIFPQNASQHL